MAETNCGCLGEHHVGTVCKYPAVVAELADEKGLSLKRLDLIRRQQSDWAEANMAVIQLRAEKAALKDKLEANLINAADMDIEHAKLRSKNAALETERDALRILAHVNDQKIADLEQRVRELEARAEAAEQAMDAEYNAGVEDAAEAVKPPNTIFAGVNLPCDSYERLQIAIRSRKRGGKLCS